MATLKLQLNRDDLLSDSTYTSPSFTETAVGNGWKVVFNDSGTPVTNGTVNFKAALEDAYAQIRENLVDSSNGWVPYRLTTTQINALTDIIHGVEVHNITTGDMWCYHDSVWVFASTSTHIVEVNSWFNMSTISTKVFIPLAGSTSESATGDDQRIFIPSNAGKLLKLRVYSTNDLASTVFTLEVGDGGSVIGTQTVTVGNSGIVDVDFTTGLDSGVNTFDGSDPLVIALNPTNNGDQISIGVIFEIDNL